MSLPVSEHSEQRGSLPFYSAFWEYSRELNLHFSGVILAPGHSVYYLGTSFRHPVFPPVTYSAFIFMDFLSRSETNK